MLKKIKSTFFIRLLFTSITEKRKLEFSKYNKNLQNILKLNIINYREFSGRFLIERKNGIFEEYDSFNSRLVFKGKYLNGKRNGRGKEYDNFKYEGEFLNGKRNGNGKEYFLSGKLMFEGEYLNGKMWNGIFYDKVYNFGYKINNGKGYIKIYDDNYFDDILLSKLIFEGEYLNGEKNGEGKEYYEKGNLKFEGEYLNGKKWNGKGYDKNGRIFKWRKKWER